MVVFTTGDGVAFAVRDPFPGTDLDAAAGLGVGVGVWFHSSGPSAIYHRLVQAGTPITQEPFTGPFGLQFSFRDPDGYTITLHGGINGDSPPNPARGQRGEQ